MIEWRQSWIASVLAEALSVQGVNEEFCTRMYDARSEWIHGAHVRLFATGGEAQEAGAAQGPQNDEQWAVFDGIARLQELSRLAVRKCFEDEDFRSTFVDDDSVRERWAQT
jgi:hypothetical protein